MPDAITPEERKMIDAALKRGAKVQRIPNGVSAYQMQWNAEKGGLRYVDAEQAERAKSGHMGGNARRGKAPDPEVARRRIKVGDMIDLGKTAPEISKALGVSIPCVYSDARQIGKKFSEAPKAVSPRTAPASTRQQRIEARRARVKEMAEAGSSGPEIADTLGVSRQTVFTDCKALDVHLAVKRRPNTGADEAGQRKKQQAEQRLAKVKDRRRFKAGLPATGEITKLVDADATGTLYPHTVANPAEADHVLKSGVNNAKIGGDVLIGWLKGAQIYTLTLEERATCPKSCALWRGCYGNVMNRAHRYAHGPALMKKLEAEVGCLMAEHERILIRLHVLGDFWSVEYVEFWRRLLFLHPGLHVFGFTAWGAETRIGSRLAALRAACPGRFAIRHSGTCAPWGSFTVDFPTGRKTLGDAVVCPAQLDANAGSPRGVHCGNCAACWSTDHPIVFMEH